MWLLLLYCCCPTATGAVRLYSANKNNIIIIYKKKINVFVYAADCVGRISASHSWTRRYLRLPRQQLSFVRFFFFYLFSNRLISGAICAGTAATAAGSRTTRNRCRMSNQGASAATFEWKFFHCCRFYVEIFGFILLLVYFSIILHLKKMVSTKTRTLWANAPHKICAPPSWFFI